MSADCLPKREKELFACIRIHVAKSWRHAVESFAASKGLQNVGYPQKISGRNLTHIGPYNWLKCFKQADYGTIARFTVLFFQ